MREKLPQPGDVVKIGKHFYRKGLDAGSESNPENVEIVVAYVRQKIAEGALVSLKAMRRLKPDLTENETMAIYAGERDKEHKAESGPGHDHEWIGIRHSRALYARLIERTDNFPLEKVPFHSDVAVRDFADISEKGKALIEQESEKLLSASIILRIFSCRIFPTKHHFLSVPSP